MIGAHEEEHNRGAAWVFTRAGSAWTEQARLVAADEIGEAALGRDVALSSDGNTALVAGIGDNKGVGAAWVFTRSGSTWSQQAKLTAAEGGHLGYAVALSSDGNTALVQGEEAVWAFTRSGSTWNQQGPKLTGSGGSGAGLFGASVALSADGNTALIGAPWDSSDAGAAWLFERAGSTWTQQGEKLTGAGESGAGRFGSSVALSSDGGTALVGGEADGYHGNASEFKGAAWAFARSGSTWTQQGEKLTGSGEIGAGYFGASVVLSAAGDTALIAAPWDNEAYGAVWVFSHSGSTWAQEGEKFTRTGESGNRCAWAGSMALSSDSSTALFGCAGGTNGAWVFVNSAPIVASVDPNAGPVSGGTAVTITGSNFTGVSAVNFGATPASGFTVNSTGSITATSPPGTATVDVTVTTPGGTSPVTPADEFTYGASVASIEPTNGPRAGGTAVVITGTGFTGASAVDFGSTPAASFTVNTPTSITAVSPAGSGTVDVTVTTPEGTSPTGPADRFTYGPVVASVSPSTGSSSGGTTVMITGSNLAGTTAVAFGSTAATSFTVNTPTSIAAVSPAGSGTVDVTVTTPEGTSSTSSADRFTYLAPPTVTSVSPESGSEAGGTSVTITGANLTGATAVAFGPTAAASFKVNSATSITATSPPGTGTVDVTVTTPVGLSATSPADQFRYLASPEYGRCLKAAKGTGRFENPTCTKAAGGTKSYEWFPATGGAQPLVEAHFTTTIKALTEAKLYTTGKHVISCTGETGSGEYSSPKGVAGVAITLTGCHLDTVGSCQTLEAQPGEIALGPLAGELGVIATSTEGPLKNKIGIALKPVSGVVVAAFACGATSVLVTGSVIGEVPRNAMQLSTTSKFVTSTKGIQKPTRFEGGEDEVLSAKLGEAGAFEQTGLKLTMVQTSEEKVEVNSVI